MDRQLDSLSSDFKPLAMELIARCVEAGVMVMVVQTSRTVSEQEQNVANGTSATLHSKHLPRSVRGLSTGTGDDSKADAMDICPFDVWQLVGPDKLQWSDDVKGHPAFAQIGAVAERLATRWGGRWQQPHDPGHIEWLFPGEHYKDIPPTSAAYAAHGVHA